MNISTKSVLSVFTLLVSIFSAGQAIAGKNLPWWEATQCEKVTIGFYKCKLPDGRKYYCVGYGTNCALASYRGSSTNAKPGTVVPPKRSVRVIRRPANKLLTRRNAPRSGTRSNSRRLRMKGKMQVR